MRPARIAADDRPLRCGAVRDGSAYGWPASLPMVDRCAAERLVCTAITTIRKQLQCATVQIRPPVHS